MPERFASSELTGAGSRRLRGVEKLPKNKIMRRGVGAAFLPLIPTATGRVLVRVRLSARGAFPKYRACNRADLS
jgi:hypothetical protein